MYIKSLSISNFRCFDNNTEPLEFNTPDGNPGSGLNILIGENGNGKTSVLEAISLLNQSRLKTKSNIDLKDFFNINSEINIEAKTTEFKVEHVYGKSKFASDGLIFKAKTRAQGSKGLLNSIVFDNVVVPADRDEVKEYELRSDVQKPWGASRLPSIEIVYFDKNRTRHISKGMFSTKLDDVVDDMNFQVLSKIQTLDETKAEDLKRKNKMLTASTLLKKAFYEDVSDKVLNNVNEDCKLFFNNMVNLDMLNNLEPFINSFFSSSPNGCTHQLPVSRLGSGFEMIFSLIFLYRFYTLERTSLIMLIDEPELHLHPVWQSKLIDYLMSISSTTQIFISTHSPYIFKNCLNKNVGLFIFNKDDKGKVVISNAYKQLCNHFPWSPSWSEINYYAYDMPTIEFHNELYGYLQDKEQKYYESEVEDYLENGGIPKSHNYIKVDNRTGSPMPAYPVTICTYIRNLIHHPENTHNAKFTETELADSIIILLSCIENSPTSKRQQPNSTSTVATTVATM